MQIRTHQYAEAAFPLVKGLCTEEIIKKAKENHRVLADSDIQAFKKLEAKYRTLALNFPTMIMQSGLAQAIGFLMAKGDHEHKTLLGHIEKILNRRTTLHADILKSDITEYQLLTRKALEASSWLKRYTQALLKKEGERQ